MAFQEAVEHDAWGQAEEATSRYNQLRVAAATEARENRLGLTAARQRAVAALAAVLQLRMQELNNTAPAGAARGPAVGLQLEGIRALEPFMRSLLTAADGPLPSVMARMLKSSEQSCNVSSSSAGLQDSHDRMSMPAVGLPPQQQQPGDSSGDLSTEEQQHHSSAAAGAGGGTLRPPPEAVAPGGVSLSVRCFSCSAKAAAAMLSPHVRLTVRDAKGKLLEAVQESPHAAASRSGDPDKLDLDFSWHLQTPVDELPQGAAVFLELLHWKPAKKKWSLACYAVLTREGCTQQGAQMLQLWKKPAAFKAGAQRVRYSSRPLYLHIVRSLTQH